MIAGAAGRRALLGLAAAAAVVLAAAALGVRFTGGPALSAADSAFVHRAGAICQTAHRQLSHAPSLAGPAGIREGAPLVLLTTAQAIGRLEHLTPTPRFRAAHRAYLGALRRQRRLIGRLRRAAAAGDGRLARRLSALLTANSTRAVAAGARLGDQRCGHRTHGDPEGEAPPSASA